MTELNTKQKYILAKFQLLPFKYFEAEELNVIFNENNITELFKNLAVLSKKKYISKKNKKFSPKYLKNRIISQFDTETLNLFKDYIDFLQKNINFNSNKHLKQKALFSKMAITYFELFTPSWNTTEIQLLNDTLIYFHKTGQIKKATQYYNKFKNQDIKNKKEFDFYLSIYKSAQLRNKAKFKKALNLLIEQKNFIKKCTNAQIILQYYLHYFDLLRNNSPQNISLKIFTQAEKKLNELNANQIIRDRLLFGKANLLIDLNASHAAIDLLIEVINRQVEYLDKLHPYLADSYALLGNAYYFSGNNELAIQYSLTALEILEFNYETDSFEKNGIRFTLASAYLANENFGLATKEIEYILASSKILSKKYHPDHSIYKSVHILLQKFQYEDPIKEMKKALKKIQKYYPKTHSIIGFFHNNIAMLLSEEGSFKKSNKHLLAAYKINFEIYKKDTINQAMLLSNMALNLESLNEYDEALNLLKRAEKILIAHLGKNHPDIAKIYQTFAEIYTQQEKAILAIKFLNKAERIIKFYNKEHPSLVSIYSSLASNHKKLEKYKTAKKLALKAYDLYNAFYSNKSSFTEVKLLNTLASIEYKNSSNENAKEYAIKAFEKLNNIWSEMLINEEMLTVAFTTCNNLFYNNQLKKSKEIAEKLNNSIRLAALLDLKISNKTKAGVLRSVALNAAADNETDFAINQLFIAIKILEKEKTIQEDYLAKYYKTLVELLLLSSEQKEDAIPYLKKLVHFEQKKGNKSNLNKQIYYIRNIGNIYYFSKKYTLAIEYQKKALNLAQSHEKLVNFIYPIYLDLARIYAHTGNVNKVTYYTLSALHSFYQTNEKEVETEIAISLQLASAYFQAAQYSQALQYAHSAEQKLNGKHKINKIIKINIYNILSGLYNDIGDKKSSDYFLKKSNKLLKETTIPKNSIFNWMHNYRIARHEASKKNFTKAIKIAEKIIKAMDSLNFFSELYVDISQFIIEIKNRLDVTQ